MDDIIGQKNESQAPLQSKPNFARWPTEIFQGVYSKRDCCVDLVNEGEEM